MGSGQRLPFDPFCSRGNLLLPPPPAWTRLLRCFAGVGVALVVMVLAVLEVLLLTACCTTATVDVTECSKSLCISCGAGTELVLLLVEV